MGVPPPIAAPGSPPDSPASVWNGMSERSPSGGHQGHRRRHRWEQCWSRGAQAPGDAVSQTAGVALGHCSRALEGPQSCECSAAKELSKTLGPLFTSSPVPPSVVAWIVAGAGQLGSRQNVRSEPECLVGLNSGGPGRCEDSADGANCNATSNGYRGESEIEDGTPLPYQGDD